MVNICKFLYIIELIGGLMKVGVIGAMDTEIKMLVENLENVVESKEVFLKFYEGNFGKTPVVIVKSGVGKVNAGICTQTLITKFGCTHIINTGVAGGIAKELAVMDTVVSTDAIFHDVNAVGFGYNMFKGVKEAISNEGFLGVLTGGFSAGAAGISAAIIAGLAASLLSKPKIK